MTLFQQGDFTLNSGAKSSWKIECDALTEDDWRGLAVMVRQMVGPFRAAVGVPRGGNALAEALRSLRTDSDDTLPVLIVDDVLTTGGSMERIREKLSSEYEYKLTRFVGVVVFARGPCASWIYPLFQMPPFCWIEKEHKPT